jgi:preprotein translocase subunit SecE
MAAGNEVSEKGGKSKAAQKQKGVFVKKIKKGVTDIRLEMKRVTWPTWRELFNYTVTVLFVCAIMGVLIYVLDLSLSQILRLTLNIGA